MFKYTHTTLFLASFSVVLKMSALEVNFFISRVHCWNTDISQVVCWPLPPGKMMFCSLSSSDNRLGELPYLGQVGACVGEEKGRRCPTAPGWWAHILLTLRDRHWMERLISLVFPTFAWGQYDTAQAPFLVHWGVTSVQVDPASLKGQSTGGPQGSHRLSTGWDNSSDQRCQTWFLVINLGNRTESNHKSVIFPQLQ